MKEDGRAVVFELNEESVGVEIYNEGEKYIGKEVYDITYEELNRYLEDGIEERDEGNNLDSLYNKMIQNTGEIVRFPDGVVRWGFVGNRMKMTILVGGKGFHTIETIRVKKEDDYERIPVGADYGGLYEVNVDVEVEEGNEPIEVDSVYKFKGLFYRESRKETELERVPYLEKYLRSVLDENLKKTRNGIQIGNIDTYITDMKAYEHTQSFLDELERVSNTNEEIDWGRVE